MSFTFAALGTIAALAIAVAMILWPADDPVEIEHAHRNLAPDHPHLADGTTTDAADGSRHRHAFVIDSHHPEWPRR